MCWGCLSGIISIEDHVARGKVSSVQSFLDEHQDVDITKANGKVLNLAIQRGIEEGNPEITQMLIDYYENVQLPKLVVGSEEYNILKFRFREALALAIEDEKLTPEMKAVLAPYVDLGDTDSRRGDFDETPPTEIDAHSSKDGAVSTLTHDDLKATGFDAEHKSDMSIASWVVEATGAMHSAE